MYLSEETARQLINLNPFPEKKIIDPTVAQRQFQVILKGFNFLLQPENNCLYIGDEVGLGKTYIALGIASLLRHFSDNPQNYIDTILVPKSNLQYKWQKEIRNFINYNYLAKDNIVKSVLGQAVAQYTGDSLKNSLCLFTNDYPAYYIFRNSSFSIASVNNEDENNENENWISKLTDILPQHQRSLFLKISKRFKTKHELIKRAFAYLLNTNLPVIDLLIVDEAHNFKHGTGNDVSVRNQMVSRILGANNNDDELFDLFPELKDLSAPKVKKLLLLSATPINKSLLEIKNQMDCFLPSHIFSAIEMNEEGAAYINEHLNKFLIRGVMNIKVNGKEYSRNGYRHEHRHGNVTMVEDGKYQTLNDDKTALVLSLMEYKTIKELKLKCGSRFEMGMLAGFESFQKSSAAYEDETLCNRTERDAKDEFVLKEILDSYYEKFNDFPPHPKQESLVDEIFELMKKREKSLVFVRRIASVQEIERKLLKKYTKELIAKVNAVKGKKVPPQVAALLQRYKDDALSDKIETTLDLLTDRIINELKSLYKSDTELTIKEALSSDVRSIYYSVVENKEIDEFKKRVKDNVGLKNIKTELKNSAVKLIVDYWNGNLKLRDDDEEDDQNFLLEERDDEGKTPYFFQHFFFNEGKSFKNKSYRKDWYEINLLLIHEHYNLFPCANWESVSKEYDFFTKDKTDIAKYQKANELILQCVKTRQTDNVNPVIQQDFKKETFLTNLLINLCQYEFSGWIDTYRRLINESSETAFIKELSTLAEIIKSIFRQGSGLLPAYLANAKSSSDEEFIAVLNALLSGEFEFVLAEIKQIIIDYEKLVDRNFDDKDKISQNLIQQLPVVGISGHHKRNVRKTAIQFRMPGYPYVLITTDILKEGEDLHSYCKNIYHYGIAWNPSDMEQRTGRIDRIDSMAYRALNNPKNSCHDQIPFENKLQVFYPYLADTLEVNQMVKLFKEMDNFIDVFYNDLSANIEKDSKADINDVIIDIPEQRKELLKSKYDYPGFVPQYNGTAMQVRLNTQITSDELLAHLKNVCNELSGFAFFEKPVLDQKDFSVSGVINLDGRRGPFNLYLKQDKQPGNFFYQMESLLGRSQVLGRSSNKREVHSEIEKYSKEKESVFTVKESNSLVFLTLKVGLEASIKEITTKLYTLVEVTDQIEERVLGVDEKLA